MSSLSLGDEPSREMDKSRSSSKDTNTHSSNNLKLSIMSDGDKSVSHRGSFDDDPDIQNLNLDDEINHILQNDNDTNKTGNTIHNNDKTSSQSLYTETRPATSLKEDADVGPLDKVSKSPIDEDPKPSNAEQTRNNSRTLNPASDHEYNKIKTSASQQTIRRNSSLVPVTSEAALGNSRKHEDDEDSSRISAYARLDFENFTFFVQTLQVVLGRKSNDELLQTSHHAVDVHLSSKKAISRRHAKIFYNFGTQRFELSVLGRNGAFVDDLFVEKGITVPLIDGTKIQVGDIPFSFVLPSIEPHESDDPRSAVAKPMNPSDAINLRSNLYSAGSVSPATKSATPPTGKPASVRRKSSIKKDPKSKLKDASARKASSSGQEAGSQARRNSKAKISRRLSEARRKSLASATNDEISEILTALGADSIDAIAEDNDEFIDAQIAAILDGHEKSGKSSHNRDVSMDDVTALKLASFNESAIEDEEDEIDRLVKQHNLEQGVSLDENMLSDDKSSKGNNVPNTGSKHGSDLNMDFAVLDQEIATLAPLIDAHNHDLLKTEDTDTTSEQNKKKKSSPKKPTAKKQISKSSDMTKTSPDLVADSAPVDSSPNPSIPITSGTPARPSPLMGKPAAPRMGKPASIQPPANRLYGRQSVSSSSTNKLPSGELQDTPQMITSISSNQLPQHATHTAIPLSSPPMTTPQPNNNIPLATNMPSSIVRPPPPRPLPPRLQVPVHSITSIQLISSTIPTKAITVDSTKFDLPPICVHKTLEEPNLAPKIPKRNKASSILKRTAKASHPSNEIPDQYKTKPNVAFPTMISTVLRARQGVNGISLPAIIEGIRELYPYYRYCPDGWQLSIVHNVELNKIYKAISKVGPQAEWLWVIDNAYIEERERVRRKQQELVAARAKSAAIKAEELKQRQRFEAQQAGIGQVASPRNLPASPYALPYNPNVRMPQSQFLSQLQHKQGSQPGTPNGQKPKTIAELASEIRRDGVVGSKAPLYFKPQSSPPIGGNPELSKLAEVQGGVSRPAAQNYTRPPSSVVPSPAVPASTTTTGYPKSSAASPGPQFSQQGPNSNTIKAQLAANRSQSPPQQPRPNSSAPVMNSETKKSLAYLQKELFVLFKARKLSYNTATTTEIITKALATTIAQVNVIGAKAGCGDNALSFLVEKAPQQVSKILDIALTKSIREKQGILSSRQSSREGTPNRQSRPSGSPPPTSASLAQVRPQSQQATPQVKSSPAAYNQPFQVQRPPTQGNNNYTPPPPQPGSRAPSSSSQSRGYHAAPSSATAIDPSTQSRQSYSSGKQGYMQSVQTQSNQPPPSQQPYGAGNNTAHSSQYPSSQSYPQSKAAPPALSPAPLPTHSKASASASTLARASTPSTGNKPGSAPQALNSNSQFVTSQSAFPPPQTNSIPNPHSRPSTPSFSSAKPSSPSTPFTTRNAVQGNSGSAPVHPSSSNYTNNGSGVHGVKMENVNVSSSKPSSGTTHNMSFVSSSEQKSKASSSVISEPLAGTDVTKAGQVHAPARTSYPGSSHPDTSSVPGKDQPRGPLTKQSAPISQQATQPSNTTAQTQPPRITGPAKALLKTTGPAEAQASQTTGPSAAQVQTAKRVSSPVNQQAKVPSQSQTTPKVPSSPHSQYQARSQPPVQPSARTMPSQPLPSTNSMSQNPASSKAQFGAGTPSAMSPTSNTGNTTPYQPHHSPGLSKPPRQGMNKPPSFQKGNSPALSRPHYSGPGPRGTGYSRGGLSRPPQFLSNKPPSYYENEGNGARNGSMESHSAQSVEPSSGDKRTMEQSIEKNNEENPNKVIKIE